MENTNKNRIKELKISRQKHIKSLSKILTILYKKEWELSENAIEVNDNICKLASKSVSEASGCIQNAISKLISTEIGDRIVKKEEKKPSEISQLKKVVLSKK